MTDNIPTITSWQASSHGTLTVSGVDIPRGLTPAESDLSDTVTPVTDLGRSVTPNPFEEYFNRDWGNKDVSGRVLTVKCAQPLEVDVFRKRLFTRFSRSALDKSEYLPRDAFEQLFDMDSIIGLVKATFPTEGSEFQVRKVDEIMKVDKKKKSRRRKLYGILVAMDKTSLMQYIVQEGLCDDDLPFRESVSDTTHSTTQINENSAAPRQTEARQNTTLFQDWERNDFYLFCNYQQIFMAPYFDFQDVNVCYYPLDHKVTLPWEKYEHKTEGGEGTVHKVQIHPSHHNYQGSPGADGKLYFAVKEVSSYNVHRFRQELEALQKNGRQIQAEKHLIDLHLTFRHRERFYLLFEWANSNLAEFWEEHPDMQVTPQVTCWIAIQCQGLARAVKRIHGLYTWPSESQSSLPKKGIDNEKTRGRHGDIKPNNILWFEQREDDYNLLVLSDLGLTRYHSQLTNSLVSRIDGCTLAYRAPEVDMRRNISQRYDIWSLGCVFLEFCVWYLQGQEGLARFDYARQKEDASNIESDHYYTMSTCDETREPRAKVKQAVLEMIKELIKKKSCPEFISELLKFIRDKMLVVEAKDRAEIDKVCTEILRIMPQGSKDYQNFRGLFTTLKVHQDNKEHLDVRGHQMNVQDNEIAFRKIGMAESLVMPVERLSPDEQVAGPTVERQPRELYIPTLNLDLQERNSFRHNGYGR